MEQLFFQTSLIAAFVAGMVALFAPCCITFLLPAYLGGVFKEREKVLLATVIFGLGIFVVLLPAVLGVAFLSRALFRYHDLLYLLGGLVMIVVAIISFLNIKFPMPNWGRQTKNGRTDVVSIFTLGVFSGLTSACCAPVLIGVLALTFLSPSFFGALLVGAMYVLGMVAPLLFISAFLSGKVDRLGILRRPLFTLDFFGKRYIILSNLIASIIFFITGFLTLFLTLTGRLSMSNLTTMTQFIQNVGGFVNQFFGGNIFLNLIFLAVVIYSLYFISKRV